MASEQGQHRITIATVLGTVWTRILAALTGVALILGIVAEVISIITGYYNMQRAQSDAAIAKANATAATATFKGLGSVSRLPDVPPDPRGSAYRKWEEN